MNGIDPLGDFQLADTGGEFLTVDQRLALVDYTEMNEGEYVPSLFALKFVNFMKLCEEGGEKTNTNKTPVLHYKMLDTIAQPSGDVIDMVFRGAGKTTRNEFIVLYLMAYGQIEGFGSVKYAMFLADSVENGCSIFKDNVEFRRKNSPVLQKLIPEFRAVEGRIETRRADGGTFRIDLVGVAGGVQGKKFEGERPKIAFIEDLLTPFNADSAAYREKIESAVFAGVGNALHPTQRKIIWTGTAYDEADPMYKAANSGAFHVNVYPVCEKFPCTREEFKGAWPDRFTYDSVLKTYSKMYKLGKVHYFYRDMMCVVAPSQDSLVDMDKDIKWVDSELIKSNLDAVSIYITTDFATSASESADFSVISVWAFTHKREWVLLDGIHKKQNMFDNIEDLFQLCEKYKPRGVGVEVSGQQGGFIDWIYREQNLRNIKFHLISDNNSSKAGVRPIGDKLTRFQMMLPLFKKGEVVFCKDLYDSQHDLTTAMFEQFSKVTINGIKSKHDDALDTFSMLSVIHPLQPSAPFAQGLESVRESYHRSLNADKYNLIYNKPKEVTNSEAKRYVD